MKDMRKIKILLDSGSDISPEYCEKYNITVVPLNIHREGKTVTDYYDFDPVEYCEYMQSAENTPKTSQPNPNQIIDYFKKFETEYDDLIMITMSRKGSGTHDSALLAKRMYEEQDPKCNIYIVDSMSTSFAIVMMAIKADELIQQGMEAEKIVEFLNEYRNHIGIYYLVDNIDFLIKGGRVSTIKGNVLNKIHLKPIITVVDGEGVNCSNAIGYRKGIAKLLHFFQTQALSKDILHVTHAHCMERVEQLKGIFSRAIPGIKFDVLQMQGTMCTHAGPGTVGISFVK